MRMRAAGACVLAAAAASGAAAQGGDPFTVRLVLDARYSEPLPPGRTFVLFAELSEPLPPDGPEGPAPGEEIIFEGAEYISHEGYACAGFCPIIYGYTLKPLDGVREVSARIEAGSLTSADGEKNEEGAEFRAAVGERVPAVPPAAAAAAAMALAALAGAARQRERASRNP